MSPITSREGTYCNITYRIPQNDVPHNFEGNQRGESAWSMIYLADTIPFKFCGCQGSLGKQTSQFLIFSSFAQINPTIDIYRSIWYNICLLVKAASPQASVRLRHGRGVGLEDTDHQMSWHIGKPWGVIGNQWWDLTAQIYRDWDAEMVTAWTTYLDGPWT